MLEDAQQDPAYALRWYALLSLAVSDEQLAAKRLWRELSEWKIEYRRLEVFGTIVAITPGWTVQQAVERFTGAASHGT